MTIYQAIAEADAAKANRTFTVVRGPYAGEKVLVTDGEITWQSEGAAFFPAHKESLSGAAGLVQVDGEEVFSETIRREKKLVICGCGHVSIPVIRLAKMLGFSVTAIDDRPQFTQAAGAAGADTVYCEGFGTALEKIPGDADTFFVIVTRGHKNDLDCVRAIAPKPQAYTGMIGSRRKVAIVKESLLAEGFDPAWVKDLHAPIGLPIGAETPEEIAVSVLAEIIEVKNRTPVSFGYPQELLAALCAPDREPMILATITRHWGSTPREAGAKILIGRRGDCVGTIGGGCAEAEVIRKAQRILTLGSGEHPLLMEADMTAEKAEEEGMVCGGRIEVLLERV